MKCHACTLPAKDACHACGKPLCLEPHGEDTRPLPQVVLLNAPVFYCSEHAPKGDTTAPGGDDTTQRPPPEERLAIPPEMLEDALARQSKGYTRHEKGLVQEGEDRVYKRFEKVLATRLMGALRVWIGTADHDWVAHDVALARYTEILATYRDALLSTPGDLKLFTSPVWCGARKIGGPHLCGYCGKSDHVWTRCSHEKADPLQQARAIACGEGTGTP